MTEASKASGQPAAGRPERPGVLAMIGNTPLVPIRVVNPNPRVEIWAKLEKMNPGGSIKDRIGLYMIEDAERRGELHRGKTILEATSGNTGIGLATVAAVKGYPITLAMSEGASLERRKILAALGAEFLLTPADKGTDGAIERAYELVAEKPDVYYMPDQFNNPANVLAHYETTAPEIWRQTGGRITHLVATMGTTGTVVGCSRFLREVSPSVRIVGVEPYLGHRIQGLKNLKEAYVPGIFSSKAIDEKVNIEDDAAYDMARRLAREEGLLVGMSSGAAMHVACDLAARLDSGVIVAILADGGERYLSTTLFQVAEPEAVPARLHFFNTLSSRYEPFEPIPGAKEVTMYSCGPTVHRRPHLGILRRMVADDLVRRALGMAGHAVRHVVSVTDMDDNTIQESEDTGEPMADLCRRHEAEFHEDCAALGIAPASEYVRASEHVDAMVALAHRLVEKGYAYEKQRSVYFSIDRVKGYGNLSGKDLGKIRVGATVDLERYDKDDPRDFTLLRKATLAEMRKGLATKTEWGNVRPTWHVHCSAMARAALGDRFDIHSASSDLVFPHNENEIAQSVAVTGEPQARVWLHSELVLSGGRKMTYSGDTCVTLPDLAARGWSPREVRFLLVQAHYRQPVVLTDERLEASRATLRRLDEFQSRLASIQGRAPRLPDLPGWIVEARDRVRKAMLDDVNVSAALAALFGLVKQVNWVVSRGTLGQEDAGDVLSAMRSMDEALGILLPADALEAAPPGVLDVVERRARAREARDFALADRLRDDLAASGWIVEDLPSGPHLKRKA